MFSVVAQNMISLSSERGDDFYKSFKFHMLKILVTIMKPLGRGTLVKGLDPKDKHSLMGLGVVDNILRKWFYPFSQCAYYHVLNTLVCQSWTLQILEVFKNNSSLVSDPVGCILLHHH